MEWVNSFVYLGNMTDGGGSRMAHVEYRVAQAQARFRQLSKVFGNGKLGLKVKLKIYKAAVCSIVKYGSESWRWDEKTKKCITSFNSKCLALFTGRREEEDDDENEEKRRRRRIKLEAAAETTTYNLELDITRRRAAWLGHILRLDESRLIKKVTMELYNYKYDGCIFDNTPDHNNNIQELHTMAQDRAEWRKFINGIQPRSTSAPQRAH